MPFDRAFIDAMVPAPPVGDRDGKRAAERSEIRDLADEIIAAQQREVEELRPHAGGGMHHG